MERPPKRSRPTSTSSAEHPSWQIVAFGARLGPTMIEFTRNDRPTIGVEVELHLVDKGRSAAVAKRFLELCFVSLPVVGRHVALADVEPPCVHDEDLREQPLALVLDRPQVRYQTRDAPQALLAEVLLETEAELLRDLRGPKLSMLRHGLLVDLLLLLDAVLLALLGRHLVFVDELLLLGQLLLADADEVLARAMLRGIQAYFQRNPPPGTVMAGRTHVIARGDTLSGIAQRFNVPLSDLKSYNGIDGSKIMVGQKLRIPTL